MKRLGIGWGGSWGL